MKKLGLFVMVSLLAFVVAACQPQVVEVEVTREVEVEKEVEVIKEVEVEKEVEVIKEVEVEKVVEVLADRGHLNVADDYSFGLATTLDPHSPNRFYMYVATAYNTLVEKDVDGSYLPSLATAWESNEDATEWTITLREGVMFHDGTEMTGADVAYSIMRLQDPEIASPLAGAFSIVEEIEVTSDYEVVFKLSQANVDLPENLTSYQAVVIKDGGGETIAEDGIGTGAFKLVTLDAAGITEMVAHDDYWGGPPGVGSMSIIAISDSEARVQAMLAGQIDYVGVTSETVLLFENNNDFLIQNIPAGDWHGMVMNVTVEPFTDPRVRKAIRMAADREEIVANALGGFGEVSCDHPVWTGDVYRNNDIDCSQDIEGAKALLAEAGYPNGIDIEVHTSALIAEWAPFLETYQAQAAEAGINLIITQSPSDGYWDEIWRQKPIAMTGWGERSASVILPEAYHSEASWSDTYYANPDFDAGLAAAASETDLEARIGIYGDLQNTLWEDSGSLIPYHLNVIRVVSSCLGGFEPIGEFFVKFEKVVKSPDCS